MTRHPKRFRDFSEAAKLVIEVATGQREDRANATRIFLRRL